MGLQQQTSQLGTQEPPAALAWPGCALRRGLALTLGPPGREANPHLGVPSVEESS